MIGTYVLSAGYYDAYYLRAQKVRTLIKQDFEDCFAHGVDAILDAGDAVGRLRHRREGRRRSGRDVSQRRVHGDGEHGRACRASRCRPGSTADGLPLGLQLIGRPFDEETLFSLGAGDRAGGRAVRAASGGGDERVMTPPSSKARCRRPPRPRSERVAHRAVVGDEGRLGARAQAGEGRGRPDAAWVHAYLHRVEGDARNARYWYGQAGRKSATGPLDAEWDAITPSCWRAATCKARRSHLIFTLAGSGRRFG